MRSRLALTFGILGLAACGPEPEPGLCPDGPSAALTDAGDLTRDLQDGEESVMVHGPQGGWHLLFGVRLYDSVREANVDVEVTALGQTIVKNVYDFRLDRLDDCTSGRMGLFGFILDQDLPGGGTPPEVLSGEELLMKLVITTESGVSEDEVLLEAVPDPSDTE